MARKNEDPAVEPEGVVKTSTEPAVPAEATVSVTFAYPMKVAGKEYARDEAAELPVPVARELVQAGRARRTVKEK